jgi:geranylgeranyl diphosphate synthase type II
LAGGSFDEALPAAAAVECVHAFSLVHDDLPAMDDDDLRRGRPTNHKVFGEAVAILAGDALLALAFELLAAHVPDPAQAARLTGELARGAGWAGMIGGQVADIEGEQQNPELERVRYIHERKTARLLAASCRLGAIAGRADETLIDRLGRFGLHLGMAFQIADDLLDITSNAEALGKSVGKDVRAGKQTYPHCLGVEQSRQAGLVEVEAALEALAPFDRAADDLRGLAAYCMDRTG